MIKHVNIIIFISLLFGCGAGSNIIRCYSRINADQLEIEKAIQRVWEKHPENRVTVKDVNKLQENNFNLKNGLKGDSSQVEVNYLVYESKFMDKILKSWLLKSKDSRFIFKLSIANCNDKNKSCSLCLDGVIRTTEMKGLESWDLPSEKKKEVKRVFEEEILKKIQMAL